MSQILKDIRSKCLDCCCGSRSEVRACELVNCTLHKYRLGTNPNRKSRQYSPEQQAELAKRLPLTGNSNPAEIQPGGEPGGDK